MWRRKITTKSNWYDLVFPKWINPEFERRFSLRQQWEEIQREKPSLHPIRKHGYASFARDFPMDWDTGNGGCPGDPPIDNLHPFWDIRTLRFLLAVPAVPWCREKYLIRTALRGVLPEMVRLRPKSPVPGFPYLTRVRQMAKPNLPNTPQLQWYVNMKKIPEWPGQSREDIDDILKVLSLHSWLLAK